jgi:hypothetical protein
MSGGNTHFFPWWLAFVLASGALGKCNGGRRIPLLCGVVLVICFNGNQGCGCISILHTLKDLLKN